MTVIVAPTLDPGAFSTLSVQLENLWDRPLSLQVAIAGPHGWSALTGQRTVILPPGREERVPFTFWVPAQASADSSHLVTLGARSMAGGFRPSSLIVSPRVKARSGASLEAADPEVEAAPGQRVPHRFWIRNTGNRAASLRWKAISIPAWKTAPEEGTISLAPGSREPLDITVLVPASTRAGTRQLLLVALHPEGDSAAALPGGPLNAQVRCLVRPGSIAEARYTSLPLRAELRFGEVGPGRHSGGLRLQTEGPVGAETELEADLDLSAGQKAAGIEGWRNQQGRLSLTRGSWTASFGDVTGDFAELAVPTLSARGVSLVSRGEVRTARLFLGRNRDPGRTSSWGLGLDEKFGSRLSAGAELLQHEEDWGRLGLRRNRLLCALGSLQGPWRSVLRLETAWSASALEGKEEQGQAAQLYLDRTGDRVQLRARLLRGDRTFGGRTGDRDAAIVHLLLVPTPALRLWSSLDASRGTASPQIDLPVRWARLRTGARIWRSGWPSLEITVGRDADREGSWGARGDSNEETLGLTATQRFGSVLAAAWTRWGSARNLASDDRGATRSYGASLGGNLLGLRAALQCAEEQSWEPLRAAPAASASVSGDLATGSSNGLLELGLGASLRHVDPTSGEGAVASDLRLRPRLDLRLASSLRLGASVSIQKLGAIQRTDRWQVHLTYARGQILPVPWSPVRGGLQGVVFIDLDEDGRQDPGEEGVAGVFILVDGEHTVTDEQGRFEFPSLKPGTYWCDLNRASLPGRLVPSGPLPREARVQAGQDLILELPLSAGSEVGGFLFLDADHNGSPSVKEGPIEGIRMHLLKGDEVVANGLTDASGRYQMAGISPGYYLLRVAPIAIPEGWEITTGPEIRVTVVPGRTVEAAPCGIAPRLRPILRTYP